MRVVLLIAVLLTFNAPAVGKVFRSGESLYSSCKSPFLGEKGECMGFILGIAEAFDGSSSGLWRSRRLALSRGTTALRYVCDHLAERIFRPCQFEHAAR
jgi:hypothetical protein